MRILRILYVRNCRGISEITGAETHLLALLERTGHAAESQLICLIDPRHGSTPWLAELTRRRIPFETIPVRHAWSIRDVRQLVGAIRHFDAAVIHTRDHRADLVGLAAARWTGRPAVATFQGWTNWPPGSWRGRLYPWVDRRALGRADLVITDSRAAAAQLARSVVQPPVVTIHNGVDTTRFDPARFRRAAPAEVAGVVTIGIVARLHPNKGQAELVAIVPELLAVCPRLQVRLVGGAPPGFDDYGTGLRRLIAERDLDRVVSVGPADAERIPAVMAALDIVVAPSTTESFSFTLLEAMAMERPVVATAVGGTPELVVDGVSGLLVTPHRPAALRDAIVRLIRSPELRHRLGREGARRVRDRFSLSAMVAETVALQREVVACHREHPDRRGARRALRARLGARMTRGA